MIINNTGIIAIILDNALNIRNTVMDDNIPFSIVIMVFFILFNP